MKSSNKCHPQESHSQEWLPNSTQMAAMEAFASCLGFLMGLAGGLTALTILCLILGKISEILLK